MKRKPDYSSLRRDSLRTECFTAHKWGSEPKHDAWSRGFKGKGAGEKKNSNSKIIIGLEKENPVCRVCYFH